MKIKKIKKNVSKDINSAKKAIRSKFNQARKKIDIAEKQAEKFIEDNPKKAVAIAAGAGAVVGASVTAFLLKHKKKK